MSVDILLSTVQAMAVSDHYPIELTLQDRDSDTHQTSSRATVGSWKDCNICGMELRTNCQDGGWIQNYEMAVCLLLFFLCSVPLMFWCTY